MGVEYVVPYYSYRDIFACLTSRHDTVYISKLRLVHTDLHYSSTALYFHASTCEIPVPVSQLGLMIFLQVFYFEL